MGVLRALVGEVWDALLPQQCIVCGRFGAALHDGCLDALPRADGARCGRCWRPVEGVAAAAGACERCAAGDGPAFEALRAPFRFEGLVRRALLEAKFRGVTAHLDPLGRAAAALVPAGWDIEAVVAVPLGRRRERSRGFNQAHEAARHVAEALGVPVTAGLVRRARETAPQAMLDAGTRQVNLRRAFEANGTPPGRVLVVDDVTTTGATLSEVARTLQAAGAAKVYALAMARED